MRDDLPTQSRMLTQMQLLVAHREARRDGAVAALAEARARCDRLAEDVDRARAAVAQCWRWRDGLLAGCALGQRPAERASTLPACEALLQRRQAGLRQANKALRAAQDDMAVKRTEAAALERALVRLHEGQALVGAQAARQRLHCEELQDEDAAAVDRSLLWRGGMP